MTAGGISLFEEGAGTTQLLEHLRARLPQQAPDALPGHDDYDFLTSRPEGFAAVKAAVLLPLIQRDEPTLLFTRRTENLAQLLWVLAKSSSARIRPAGMVTTESAALAMPLALPNQLRSTV